jgi:hypothetical protein
MNLSQKHVAMNQRRSLQTYTTVLLDHTSKTATNNNSFVALWMVTMVESEHGFYF